jgi:hypothetical protein
MVKTPFFPTSGQRWLVAFIAMAAVSITLSLSSMFLATASQGYFNDKRDVIQRGWKTLDRSIPSFEDPAYKYGYSRGQDDAYGDASRYVSWRGLAALGLGEFLLFACLAILFLKLNRKRIREGEE